MKKLEKITNWANSKPGISALILSGSLAGKGSKDALSDYDIAVYGNEFDFIKSDDWLREIDDYVVCIHDSFGFSGYEIPTRLTIFEDTIKVDFSFHPLQSLHALINQKKLPDAYNIGYQILLDKDGIASKMQKPTYQGFVINKPSAMDFEQNIKEFWFEIYHVAKYLSRNDLWTAKLRDGAAKTWLRKMIEWHHAIKMNRAFSPKNDGKDMHEWIDEKIWKDLHGAFGRFDKKDSWKAMEKTTKIYRKIATKTAAHLKYKYNQKIDDAISGFIVKLK